MAAMRRSRMELTMNFYTDPVLLDVAGAVEALPDFSGKVAGTAGRGLKTAVARREERDDGGRKVALTQLPQLRL